MLHLQNVLPNHYDLIEEIKKECSQFEPEMDPSSGPYWSFDDYSPRDTDSRKNKDSIISKLSNWIINHIFKDQCYVETLIINQYHADSKCEFHSDCLADHDTVVISLSLGCDVDFVFRNEHYEQIHKLNGGDLFVFDSRLDSMYNHGIDRIPEERISMIFFVQKYHNVKELKPIEKIKPFE